MSHLDLLLNKPSAGGTDFSRTDFHVYVWPYDAVGGLQVDTAGFSYYRNNGLNFTRDFYDIAGTTAYTQVATEAGITFWAGRSEWAEIDLWWVDNESSRYDGTTANAAININETSDMAGWARAKWAALKGTPFYLGIYGNNFGINGHNGSYSWNINQATSLTAQTDNDNVGSQVAGLLDWMGPELYQTKLCDFATDCDWMCNEKTRMGLTAKLIPLVMRGVSTTYDFMYNRLEYLIRRPECNGVVLWGTDVSAGSPTYYDAREWMQATLDFCSAYGISAGTPF